ncbi:MAG: hypothetical protein P9L99_12155 [Candidatus Lernaella stagnicola]|nr:hypothetical protein [Candidatus Lernaella stagnicola]
MKYFPAKSAGCRTCLPGLAIVLIGVFFVTGCSDTLNQYMPLDVTNYWIYDVQAAGGGKRKVMEQVIKRGGDKYTLNNGEVLLYLPNQAIMNKQGVTILDKNLRLHHTWVDSEMLFEVTRKNFEVTVPAGTYRETLEVTWTTKYPGDVAITPNVAPILDPGSNPRVFIYTTIYARHVGKVREQYVTIQPDGTKTVEFIAELMEYKLRPR